MIAEDFARAAIALLRTSVGWQTRIADRLRVNPRRVREWLARGETPPWVDEEIRSLAGGTGAGPWPRDEWVIGDAPPTAPGQDRREYVVHLAPPRFVARVVRVDEGQPEPAEEPADVHTGVVYQVDEETVLCEIDWIDQPQAAEMTALLEAACRAIDGSGD